MRKTMKKAIVVVLFLLMSQTAFAYFEPIKCGTQGNCVNKNLVTLSNDVIDLQNQINALVAQRVGGAIVPNQNLNTPDPQLQTLTKRVYDLEQENIKLKAQIANHESRITKAEGWITKIRKILHI